MSSQQKTDQHTRDREPNKDGKRPACPDCGSLEVRPRTPSMQETQTDKRAHYCKECKEPFLRPVYREPEGSGPSPAATLSNLGVSIDDLPAFNTEKTDG